MKASIVSSILALPLLLGGCYTTVESYPARRVAYVDRDYRYHRHHRDYDRYDYRRDRYGDRYDRYDRRRTNVVVVEPRRVQPQVEVRYYSDPRGRYYIRNGRRIYVNSGVFY